MFRRASSAVSARTIAISAPFVAVYTDQFGAPTWLPTKEVKMIDPPGSISGRSFCRVKN
jgi:hypothetical protein